MKIRIFLVCCLVAASVSDAAAQKINVMILTGQNNHKWQETTPALKTILEQTGKFTLDVVTEPEQLTAQKLAQYGVILSNWNNWVGKTKNAPPQVPWSAELKKAYVDFVKNGGGHVMIHAGSSSFFDWNDYQDICCATWKLGQTGHGPKHEFDVRMAETEHPITKGMEAFKTTDELWHKPEVRPGVQVLTEACSNVTKNWEPSAMVNQFGKGRCFALMLGHGGEHMQNAAFQTLLVRGTEWASGKAAICEEESKQQVKNVLLLYVDDLRPEINCYGKSQMITPNIDKLAERAVVFNKAYCQVPVCMPSRVSTLSGMHAGKVSQGKLQQLLPAGKPSLPGLFKANGYDTISIGKVYHYNNDDPESWTKRYTNTFHEAKYVCDGWCSGYQRPENRDAVRNFRQKDWTKKSPLTECCDAPDNAYPDGATADKAIADLKKYSKSGKPLFLAAGFYRPHLPWVAPKKYWDLYQREDIETVKNSYFPNGAIGRNGWSDLCHYNDETVMKADVLRTDYDADTYPVLPEDKQKELIHGYRACVSFIDAQIGRILDALEDSGMADHTAVVMLGDNGWQLGEHKLWSKCSNYEEAVRVTLLMAVPGATEGRKTDSLAELVDIYPTLCEFAGLDIPQHVEGVSMMPLLKDPSRKWKKAAFNVWHGSQSMRTDRYRLTRYDKPMPDGSRYQLPGQGRYELYDYEADPDGNVNIAAKPENKSLLEELNKMMDAGWKAVRPEY